MLECVDYAAIRNGICAGDIIAFDGQGFVSWLVRKVAGSPSHIAIVAKTTDAGDGRMRVQTIESTSMKTSTGKRVIGVQRAYLSDRLAAYSGGVYWLPLSIKVRGLVTSRELNAFLDLQDGKGYDFWQCARRGIRQFFAVLPVKESLRRVYCSELAAAALKHLGILPKSINPSEVSPRDLCRFQIYGETLFQLQGAPKNIEGFNSEKLEREGA